MVIKNGKIFGTDGVFRKGSIFVSENKIAEIIYDDSGESVCADSPFWYAFHEKTSMENTVDASDCYIIPGMIDIHLHGCNGYDLCDGTQRAIWEIADYQIKHGVTGMVPATMTLSRERLREIFQTVGTYEDKEGSRFLGATMEGPFLSAARKGAQKGEYIQKPDVAFLREMQELSGGRIRQVVVAPEEDKEFAFIKEIAAEIVVSLGHTRADYKTAEKAFEWGANHVTHLFNAMPEWLHRSPGLIGAAYDRKEVFVELICDGVHVHPTMVRAAFALFGAERICMISDSIRATGMPEGIYTLGGQEVCVKGRICTLADKTLAGSASNLHDCLKRAVLEMGISLEDAVLSCTRTPVRSLGLDKEWGSITVGRTADLVLLDEKLDIQYVIKDGKIVI